MTKFEILPPDGIKEQFATYQYGLDKQKSTRLFESVKHHLHVLGDEMRNIRMSKVTDDDVLYNSMNYTLEEGVKIAFGADLNDFMHCLGFNPEKMPLNHLVKKLSGNEKVLSLNQWREIIDHAYSGNSVSGIDPAHALLYTEMIRRPIMLTYEKSAMYPNWIAGVIPVREDTGSIPVINGNDLFARDSKGKIRGNGETAQSRSAVIEWKDKPYKVEELRFSVTITDRMLRVLPFNTMQFALASSVSLQSPSAENIFVRYLYNGDLPNDEEKPKVIGVSNTGSITRKDFERVRRRYAMNGVVFDQIIPSENLATQNLLQSGDEKMFRELYPAINVNDVPLVNDNGEEKTDRTLVWDKRKAIVQLSHESPQFETERLASEAAMKVHVRQWIGFAIWNKTAIAHIDESLAFANTQYPGIHPVYRGNIGAGA